MSDQQDSGGCCGLEVHTCEYCGKIKPVKYFADVDTPHVFSYLDEYFRIHGGPKLYKCRDCAIDIENKLEDGDSKKL